MPFSTKTPEIRKLARRAWLNRAMDSHAACAAAGAFVGLLISLLFM